MEFDPIFPTTVWQHNFYSLIDGKGTPNQEKGGKSHLVVALEIERERRQERKNGSMQSPGGGITMLSILSFNLYRWMKFIEVTGGFHLQCTHRG